jgi:Na+-transporting methylmalonyl-CoA/oxaloacetate decarboxylase gamma subunit
MSTNMLIALQIALAGMTIVFIAILLIWILLSVITLSGSLQKKQPDQAQETLRKQKAAALAVAQALMEQKERHKAIYHIPPTAIVSAWQLSMRTNQLNKGGKKG